MSPPRKSQLAVVVAAAASLGLVTVAGGVYGPAASADGATRLEDGSDERGLASQARLSRDRVAVAATAAGTPPRGRHACLNDDSRTFDAAPSDAGASPVLGAGASGVPEPATVTLLAMGAAGLLIRRHRRSRKV